jgi:hypothetical protein
MDMKELAVVFFYNTIRGFIDKMAGNFGIPSDILLAIIGYYFRDKWYGKGLLYGAVAALGTSGGLNLGSLLTPAPKAQTQSAFAGVVA